MHLWIGAQKSLLLISVLVRGCEQDVRGLRGGMLSSRGCNQLVGFLKTILFKRQEENAREMVYRHSCRWENGSLGRVEILRDDAECLNGQMCL